MHSGTLGPETHAIFQLSVLGCRHPAWSPKGANLLVRSSKLLPLANIVFPSASMSELFVVMAMKSHLVLAEHDHKNRGFYGIIESS